jgi:hypothetical protein
LGPGAKEEDVQNPSRQKEQIPDSSIFNSSISGVIIRKACLHGPGQSNSGNLEINLHNAFKAATASNGVDMTTVLVEFIQSYVAKYESTPPRKSRRA